MRGVDGDIVTMVVMNTFRVMMANIVLPYVGSPESRKRDRDVVPGEEDNLMMLYFGGRSNPLLVLR